MRLIGTSLDLTESKITEETLHQRAGADAYFTRSGDIKALLLAMR